ncbi:dehydrogenase/reductase SDR family member 12 [Marchantia polymorpha subsp. ruderalis]|uniref:Uncharacterized protein n=2 Tax=Marchantia polymorpha TaxID=3197 RepID=A0AAF6BCM4_MARPO|nr:hypothetical protein MARPO_0020s0012 [Marchantia polymorpha]BBN09758.1 hypothetical protein Mp_4g22420 [Marchantia polymorpha subsp. ruderalis]|eukprot:PTQ44340.1 hypothetical protein MARPO_0020s0012 [Marchantia polymorpha]
MGSADQTGCQIWGPLNFIHPEKARSLYIEHVYEHYCKYWCSTRQGFLRKAKTFRKEDTDVNMTGKVCMVTGANQGIGYAIAQAFASRGAKVYMVCRNKERGEIAVSKIRSETDNKRVFLEVCDISSLQQIQTLTSRFNDTNQPLHVLVNNAGGLELTRRESEDGLELNFATNVAGMFRITELLQPALKKAAPDCRVISVSSSRMYLSSLSMSLQFDDEGKFNPMEHYQQYKRLQVAITEYWAKIYGPQGIGFYSMHPGWVETEAVRRNNPKLYEKQRKFMRTPEQGADTVLWLALKPRSKLEQGGFFIDRSARAKHLPGFGTSYTDESFSTTMRVVREKCTLLMP